MVKYLYQGREAFLPMWKNYYGILHTFHVPIPPLDLHLSYVSQESIFVIIFSHFHCQGSEKRVVISQFVRHNFPLVYNKERVIQLKS